jgi:N-carbamoylputrescine amidase
MEMSRKVNVALIQRSVTLDPDENLRETVKDIERAAEMGANIVCTQELFRSIYFCQTEDYQYFDLAEPIPGPSTEVLGPIAKKHGIVLVASLFERRTQGLYHNTAVVFDADGSIAGKYRKMHIPDDPQFYEKFYFTPGDLGFNAFQTKFGKVGVLICWDQWYPEAARLTALAGAEILFYPTAIAWHPEEKEQYGVAQHSSWETIQRSHAIANGVYVAAPNRVGFEGDRERDGGLQFWGQSFICDPSGTILAKAGDEKSEIIMAECDFDRINFQRTHWPFLRDRRIDAYGEIIKRYRD